MHHLITLLFLLFMSGFSFAAETSVPALVSAQWLSDHLSDQHLVVLDVRSGIDKGGDRNSFVREHIPEAVYSSYTRGGWRETRNGVVGLLPSVDSMERLIGNLGITNDSTVVVVPAGTGPTDFGSAARVYWTFRVLGHNAVTILNGGFSGWKAAGHQVATGEGKDAPAAQFKARLQDKLIASLNEVEVAREAQAQLVDARPVDYFRGDVKSPVVKAAGTIPGSTNVPHHSFIGEQNNVFYLNRDSIADKVNHAELDPQVRTIAFCNTGHWAATDWFVLSELAGFREVALYDGSMAEWSQNSDRPLQVAKKRLANILDVFN